jgi:predicted TPR repeat methyltransferase
MLSLTPKKSRKLPKACRGCHKKRCEARDKSMSMGWEIDPLINSWRDSAEVFESQLALNEGYLTTGMYPPHWFQFLRLIHNASTLVHRPLVKMLDIGCGCGACSELCRTELPEITYHGFDYSPHAVDTARKRWGGDKFEVKDFWEIKQEDIEGYDFIYTDALFDVMSNGDEAVEYLLSLNPRMVLMNRVDLSTEDGKTKVSTYRAYDQIPTYAYKHDPLRLYPALSRYHLQTDGNAFLIWTS